MNFPRNWRPYVKSRRFVVSVAAALFLLIAGITVTYFAIVYATERSSAPVTDIILSNIPVVDVDGLFVYGPIVFWVLIGAYVIFAKPQKIPFTLESIGIFLIIRSVFISLTHIGPFPDHIQIDTTSGIPAIFTVLTAGNDLFFSSHTGLPFLMALNFWDEKPLRYLSLAASLLLGTVVLLAHLHYSIDVFAAFFITYTIFHIAEKFFREDRRVFRYGLGS